MISSLLSDDPHNTDLLEQYLQQENDNPKPDATRTTQPARPIHIPLTTTPAAPSFDQPGQAEALTSLLSKRIRSHFRSSMENSNISGSPST